MVARRRPGFPTTIFVAPSEVMAAKMKVRRMRERGETPPSALVRIAEAKRHVRPDPALADEQPDDRAS